MSVFDVRVDAGEMKKMAALIRQAERKAPNAIAGGINETFGKARTQVVRALVTQTGAKYGDVRKALTYKRAYVSNLEATIEGRGPYMSLRMFNPKVKLRRLWNVRTRSKKPRMYQVVEASPWGVRRQFPGMFMVGYRMGRTFRHTGVGRFGADRFGKVQFTNGQVYVRKGKERFPIRSTYGPAIPKEMVKDVTASAFLKVADEMPEVVGRYLLKVMSGEGWTSRVGQSRRS